LCFTAFQMVLLVLVGIVGRRQSRLMAALLARSRRTHGLLWRHWPLLYLVLLAALGLAFALDVLGYHYASSTLWLRVGLALLVLLVVVWLDYRLSALLDRLAGQQGPMSPNLWAWLDKGRPVIRVGLGLSGLLGLAHVYGIRQGPLELLDSVALLEVGRNREGQILWLTLRDVVQAVLIMAGTAVVVRHLASICEALLFPRVRWDAGLRYTFLTLSRYVLLFVALWWSL